MKQKTGRAYVKQKRILTGIAVLLFLAGIFIFTRLAPGREKYSVYGQFSFGGGEYRETVVNVVVSWNASVDEIADEIIQEYLRVNAENSSDKITLRMYRSEWAMQHGICFRELFYVT